MSNRLLREPDVIKAILENKELFRTGRDIQRFAVIVGSIPAVDVELNLKLAYERGKADRPQGDVDAVAIFEREMHNLEQGYITIGEFDERIEPLRHLCYGRPQGEWIKDENGDYRCSNCGGCEEQYIYGTENWYGCGESKFCPSCGARMKGVDDESVDSN